MSLYPQLNPKQGETIMNKADLISKVVEKTGLTKADTAKALNGIIDTISARKKPVFKAGKQLKELVNK